MVIMYLYHTVTQSKIHKNFTPLFITKLWHMLILVSEKAISPHSGTLAWKIPWTQEPGGLQSMGSLRIRRPSHFTFTLHFHALEKKMATHSSILAFRILAAIYGVAQSWTRLKQLISSSRLVITFLPRSKHLLISWLQSTSAVILEPRKIKSAIVSTDSPSLCHEVMRLDAMILVFLMLSFKPTFHSPFSLSSGGSLHILECL